MPRVYCKHEAILMLKTVGNARFPRSLLGDINFRKLNSKYRDILNIALSLAAYQEEDYEIFNTSITLQPGQFVVTIREFLSFCAPDVTKFAVEKAFADFESLGWWKVETLTPDNLTEARQDSRQEARQYFGQRKTLITFTIPGLYDKEKKKAGQKTNQKANQETRQENSPPILDIQKEEEKEKREKEKEARAPKKFFGNDQKVQLSDEDYQGLIGHLGGERSLLEYIESLNDYICLKGKDPYVDHAATIRQWRRRDKQKVAGPPNHRQEQNDRQVRDYLEANPEIGNRF